MVRVKKELGSTSNNGNVAARDLRSRKIGGNSASDESANPRNGKRIKVDSTSNGSAAVDENQRNGINEQQEDDEVVVRRNLRSRYLAVKNQLSEEDLSRPDSDKFKTMMEEVENLHQKVRKPREQVADAEALLDITSSFVKSVKAQKNEGVTPSDFVSCLLRDFGREGRTTSSSDSSNLILWKDIGIAVSHIFRKGSGCCTMLGPMSYELKKRKTVVRKKHVKPTELARPEELDNVAEEKTDTDKNMATIFGILRKNKRVRLENLILNRKSFSQTVENLFALSFLVKDGRAEIAANENGHFVCPRNAPAAEAVASGKVSYSHFIFRFDFQDWKLMLDSVKEGEELMPHRAQADTSAHSESTAEPENGDPTTMGTTTPIRKLSRNRGLVLQEQTVVDNSPESDENRSRAAYIRKGKAKVRN